MDKVKISTVKIAPDGAISRVERYEGDNIELSKEAKDEVVVTFNDRISEGYNNFESILVRNEDVLSIRLNNRGYCVELLEDKYLVIRRIYQFETEPGRSFNGY